MDYIFREQLSDLIDLKEIKMVDTCNKKVISTSIFIPEDPSVSCKTFGYFTDLIKSVETFSNTGLEGGFIEFTLMTCFSVEYPKNLNLLFG